MFWLGIVDTVARVVADLGDPAAGTLEDVLVSRVVSGFLVWC